MDNLKILNILHLPYYAGTETAYVNLTKVLSKKNMVLCVIPENSKTKNDLKNIIGENLIEYNRVFKNFGRFDIFAKLKIAGIIKRNNIDLVIVHNGRMVDMLKSSAIKTPILACNHGTNPKKTAKADYAFVISSKMYHDVNVAGLNKEKIFLIPNYLDIK